MKRYLFPLILGIGGVAILVSLGTWQLQRLGWKEALLAGIETRIAAAPEALPASPEAPRDQYLPVTASGQFTAETIRVLTGVPGIGSGYRIISVMETGGRRILVDRGYVPLDEEGAEVAAGEAEVTGNLLWPQEADSFTPAPDTAKNLWFARDVTAMAAALGTEPVLLVARAVSPPDAALIPAPVGTEGIANDHLQYAITWFSLALVWAGMTAFLLWRIHRRTN